MRKNLSFYAREKLKKGRHWTETKKVLLVIFPKLVQEAENERTKRIIKRHVKKPLIIEARG